MIAVITPLIGEPAERTEPQMLDRIDKLAKVLTAVSDDLQDLETNMRSPLKAILSLQEAQERINRCVRSLTRSTQAFHVESLVQADIDRLRYYLDLKKDIHAVTEMSAWTLLDQRLKPVSARYNSSTRGGVSGCLEGTRVTILQTLRQWISSPAEARLQLFWLKGQAGTGKSAIAHTISEDCATMGNLGASFFFSRDQADRADGLRVFTTIAYQLAYSISGVRARLVTALQENLDATSSGLLTQLTKLIVEPLYEVASGAPSPIVIVLDALNECENASHAAEIVRHLASIASKLPDRCRLRILVTSRPEPNIEDAIRTMVSDMAKFSSVGQARDKSMGDLQSAKAASQMRLEVASLDDIEPATAKHDTRLYLKHCLQYKKHIASDAEVERLVEIGQGLFIVASTAVRFIEDSFTSDTEGWRDQLGVLLSAEDNYKHHIFRTLDAPEPGATETGRTNPLGALDLMYSEILQKPYRAGARRCISKKMLWRSLGPSLYSLIPSPRGH
ncbi:hypothetical protein FRB95_007045 [Tulasnella sp. JGI-2019a]|nr:hypothetical protein FRB95_007045 [Tulasnella sp. JGI-2019a]